MNRDDSFILIEFLVNYSLWYLFKKNQDFLTLILPLIVFEHSRIRGFAFKSVMGYPPIQLLSANLEFSLLAWFTSGKFNILSSK